MDFESALERFPWRPIAGCPGRYVLKYGTGDLTIADIAGSEAVFLEYHVSSAQDPVCVSKIEGGGLISYRKSSGRYLHTLNDNHGFSRKLADLGIEE